MNAVNVFNGDQGQESTGPAAATAVTAATPAEALDPIGDHVIEGLRRRAAQHQGDAQHLMLRRVEQLLAEQAAATRRSTAASGESRRALPARAPSLVALSALVDRLGRSAPASSADAPGEAAGVPASAVGADTRMALPAPLRSVVAHKETWSRLKAELRLRQVLGEVPARAGPMNSVHVMSQALQALHDLSPAYLDAFLSHVDTLLWLEKTPTPPVAGDRASAPSGAKRRARPRGSAKA